MPKAPPSHGHVSTAPRHKPKASAARPKERKTPKGNHVFSGGKGSASRYRIAVALWLAQDCACNMCDQGIPGSLKGRDCHVDHIRPAALRPDLSRDGDNMQLICIPCHNVICQRIERKHWPDDDRIAAEKAAHSAKHKPRANVARNGNLQS